MGALQCAPNAKYVMTKKTYTPEEIADMEQAVMAFHAEQAEEARMVRENHLSNIKTIASSVGYQTTLESLRDVQAEYALDESLAPHIHALVNIMDYVSGFLGVSSSVVEPVAEAPSLIPMANDPATVQTGE